MPKINPFGLVRPTRQVREVTLADPSQPGVTLVVKLRALDSVDLHVSEELAQAAIAKYLGPEALPFPPVQGDLVEISEALLRSAATLKQMQVADDPEDLYAIEEWVAIAATMPNAWAELGSISDEITLSGPLGGVAGKLAASQGLPYSTLRGTQSSTSESTSSSGLSTSDSEPLGTV